MRTLLTNVSDLWWPMRLFHTFDSTWRHYYQIWLTCGAYKPTKGNLLLLIMTSKRFYFQKKLSVLLSVYYSVIIFEYVRYLLLIRGVSGFHNK